MRGANLLNTPNSFVAAFEPISRDGRVDKSKQRRLSTALDEARGAVVSLEPGKRLAIAEDSAEESLIPTDARRRHRDSLEGVDEAVVGALDNRCPPIFAQLSEVQFQAIEAIADNASAVVKLIKALSCGATIRVRIPRQSG